jgi:hypothetical protein
MALTPPLPTETAIEIEASANPLQETLTAQRSTDSAEKIVAHLPPMIVRNSTLTGLVSAIGASVDNFTVFIMEARSALSAKYGAGQVLDGLALDNGLPRCHKEPDIVLAIRIQNAIHTYRARGTRNGFIRETAELYGVSAFVRQCRYILGINPVGLGFGLGGVGSEWIQVWNDSPISEVDLTAELKSRLPISSSIGIEVIDVYSGGPTFQKVEKEALAGTGYTVTVVGFDYTQECLVPESALEAVYTCGNIDLLGTYATYKWIVDWVDYARWDVDMDIKMEVRFSSDEAVWHPWNEYQKNQYVAGSEQERYAQFRLTVTMNEYEDLRHYAFRKFILKGQTATQYKYGTDPVPVEIITQIGN